MRRKTVAQRMGACLLRQAKPQAKADHHLAYLPLIEPLAAHAHKERIIGTETMRAESEIFLHGLPRGGKHWHDALLVALADDAQRFAERCCLAVERQGFRHAKP